MTILGILLGIIGCLIGAFGTYYSYRAWQQTKRLESLQRIDAERRQQPVRLVLKHPDGRRKVLSPPVPRGDLSRAEVQGILSNAKHDPERYHIPSLGTDAFVVAVSGLHAGSGPNAALFIECPETEYAKFSGEEELPLAAPPATPDPALDTEREP